MSFTVVAANPTVQQYKHQPSQVWRDVLTLLGYVKPAMEELARDTLQAMQFKINISLRIEMERLKPDTGESQDIKAFFTSRSMIVLPSRRCSLCAAVGVF